MLAEPDIPDAIWILLWSCVVSCKGMLTQAFFFFTVFYPYWFSIFVLSYGFNFEAVYWSQILAQMLTPNSTPEVAAKTACG